MFVLTRSRRAHTAGCAGFWSWAILGAAAAVSVLIFGVPALAVFGLAGALLASRRRLGRVTLGFVSGMGAPLLYVAWLNRSGPGMTCWQTATATGCDQHLDPLPWLLIGMALFIGGVVAYARRGS